MSADACGMAYTIIISSPDLTLSFVECGMRLGIAYLASGLFLHSGCGKGETNFPYPVPRPHYSGRPMRNGSLSPGEEVRRLPPVRPGDITVVN